MENAHTLSHTVTHSMWTMYHPGVVRRNRTANHTHTKHAFLVLHGVPGSYRHHTCRGDGGKKEERRRGEERRERKAIRLVGCVSVQHLYVEEGERTFLLSCVLVLPRYLCPALGPSCVLSRES